MRTISPGLCIALLLTGPAAQAETPRQIALGYAADAAGPAGFAPDAKRGGALFRRRFAINDTMPGCTACHTDNPLQAGRHALTGKAIKPLAVAANPERFSDPAKVEKWFGRNCKEVVGRACTPAEKADFVAFLNEVH